MLAAVMLHDDRGEFRHTVMVHPGRTSTGTGRDGMPLGIQSLSLTLSLLMVWVYIWIFVAVIICKIGGISVCLS